MLACSLHARTRIVPVSSRISKVASFIVSPLEVLTSLVMGSLEISPFTLMVPENGVSSTMCVVWSSLCLVMLTKVA